MNDPEFRHDQAHTLNSEELKRYAVKLYQSACHFQASADKDARNPERLCYTSVWWSRLLKQSIQLLKDRGSPLDEATLVWPYEPRPEHANEMNEISTRFGYLSGP